MMFFSIGARGNGPFGSGGGRRLGERYYRR
jgi:hypothetical protein